MNSQSLFHNGTGLTFPGLSRAALDNLFQLRKSEYGLTDSQLIEASSYSLAMVARFALGLSAREGRVCALVGDSLASCICLATLRHLINSGAEGIILFIGQRPDSPSSEFALQLKPLERMGAHFETWSLDNPQHIRALFGSCHNILCGLHGAMTPQDIFSKQVIDLLNDIQTPVHCVIQPPGVDPDSGLKDPVPLFASSTLSLGAPLQGLFTGHEYAGRHYLCDVSFTSELYKKHGTDLSPLFAEQPVIQIFPLLEKDTTDDV